MVDDHGFSNSNENSEERNVQQGQQSVGSKNSKTNVNSSEIQIIQPEKDASNNSNDGPTSQQSVGFDLENNQNNGTNSQLNLAVRQNETGDDRENHQDTAEDVSNGPAVTSQRYQRYYYHFSLSILF